LRLAGVEGQAEEQDERENDETRRCVHGDEGKPRSSGLQTADTKKTAISNRRS
jgi:hypothetical protein